jgi:NAD-dependent histone deacetylase SIR2
MKHVTLDTKAASTLPLSSQTTLRQLTGTILQSSRIIVVAGAGISCASGIPVSPPSPFLDIRSSPYSQQDFRSQEGLYALCPSSTASNITGQDLFSAHCLARPDTLAAFNTFIGNLSTLCAKASPTKTHTLLRALEARAKLSPRGAKKGRGEGKGRLLRVYTQNIDGLEEKVGLGTGLSSQKKDQAATSTTTPLVIKLHGSLSNSRCTLCQTTIPTSAAYTDLYIAGQSPSCPTCADRCAIRAARSARGIKIGALRPGLVLYDEPHPDAEKIGNVQVKDVDPAKGREPEMVIVMGTSLKVHGVKNFLRSLVKTIRANHSTDTMPSHRIAFINKTAPPAEFKDAFDVWVEGDCDAWATATEAEWKRQRPWEWETQEKLALSFTSGRPAEAEKAKSKENAPVPDAPRKAAAPSLKRKRTVEPVAQKPSSPRRPLSTVQTDVPLTPAQTPTRTLARPATFERYRRRIVDSDSEEEDPDVVPDSEPEDEERSSKMPRLQMPDTPPQTPRTPRTPISRPRSTRSTRA